MASTEEAEAEAGAKAPKKNVSYPLRILYCGECTLPVEYCEYMPNNDKCKAWLEKNLPSEFGKLYLSEKPPEGGDTGDTDKKGRQKRGGRGNIKIKKKAEPQGTDEDEIVIQGDVTDDIFDVIPEKWPEIDEDNIDDLGDQKR
ncbi:hypothetical protein Bbelb_146030 [Branchiostoma belcheri]|nr:hypothetical protein Bbelb_146030 [Branchiostoma belcheri]